MNGIDVRADGMWMSITVDGKPSTRRCLPVRERPSQQDQIFARSVLPELFDGEELVETMEGLQIVSVGRKRD